MKFRIARESEFENRKKCKLNPMRGTSYEDRVHQSPEFEATWMLEVADLEELRNLHNEIVQIETGGQPPTVCVDFLPHFEETPADCDGMIFICD
ncbi:hypothetical protein IV102_03015 [bacterium]|jgi:hypothetical protein|nr:hypothetical protein [bacterium]